MKSIISLSTAGGGKTYRLIERVSSLIKNGTQKERILIISFTNATCDDINRRCGIVAHTIHSFAFQYVGNNKSIAENPKKLVQIFLEKYFYLSKVGLDQVTKLLESFFIFKTIQKDSSFLQTDDQIANEEFKKLIEEVQEEKEKHSIMFFAEIIHKFKNELQEFLQEIFETYDHILVDEAQDLSEIQLEIVFKMMEEIFTEQGKTFYVVGDVKQSIYDFQGSSPAIYLNFIEDLKELAYRKAIEFDIEVSKKTYRFGGEILKKINLNFEEHTSDKNDGLCFEKYIHKDNVPEEIKAIVNECLEKYKNDDIMILYERNTALIKKVQEELIDKGFEQKVMLLGNAVVEALQDINSWIQTGFDYYRARILQGPFYYIKEPEFYNLCKSDLLKSFEQEFFKELYKNPMETIIKRPFYGSELDLEIFKQLYFISKSHESFASFIFNIPDSILIKKEGIKYSTVHSSKGLEAPVVIYIKQEKRADSLFINLKPFFFFKQNESEETSKSIENLRIGKEDQRKNLQYVAVTRAKERLYIVNVSS